MKTFDHEHQYSLLIINYHILTKHYINLSELTLLESKAIRVTNTIQSNSFEKNRSIY